MDATSKTQVIKATVASGGTIGQGMDVARHLGLVEYTCETPQEFARHAAIKALVDEGYGVRQAFEYVRSE